MVVLARLRMVGADKALREVHVCPAQAKLVGLAEAGVEGDSDLGPVALPDFPMQDALLVLREVTHPLVRFLEEVLRKDGAGTCDTVLDGPPIDTAEEGQFAVAARLGHLLRAA